MWTPLESKFNCCLCIDHPLPLIENQFGCTGRPFSRHGGPKLGRKDRRVSASSFSCDSRPGTISQFLLPAHPRLKEGGKHNQPPTFSSGRSPSLTPSIVVPHWPPSAKEGGQGYCLSFFKWRYTSWDTLKCRWSSVLWLVCNLGRISIVSADWLPLMVSDDYTNLWLLCPAPLSYQSPRHQSYI